MLGTSGTVKLPSTFSYVVGVVRRDGDAARTRSLSRGRKPLAGRPA